MDVGHFAPAEFKLIEWDICLAEVSKKSKFFGSQNEKGVALTTLTTGRTTNAVDVLLRIIWRIELKVEERNESLGPVVYNLTAPFTTKNTLAALLPG